MCNNSLDDLLVNKPRSHKLGVVQPREESTLDDVIKRNPVNQKSQNTLGNRKSGKYDPISQPLSIIGSLTGVDGLE